MKLLYPLLSVLFLIPSACTDPPTRAKPTATAQPATPPASAATCARTICDLKAENCTDLPERDYCGDCWDACEANLNDRSLCPKTCNDLCKRRGPHIDLCKERLDSCRRSKQNSVCIDGIEQATDGHPCGDVASRAACASIDDLEAQRAIYAANPECKKCDEGWEDRCFHSVCQDEWRRVDACAKKAGCHEALECERCDRDANAYLACSWKAMGDPQDRGGCNSGAHKCWTMPICNDDGTARK